MFSCFVVVCFVFDAFWFQHHNQQYGLGQKWSHQSPTSLKFYLLSTSINSNKTGGLLLFLKMIIDSFRLHMTLYVYAPAPTVTKKELVKKTTTFTYVSTVSQMWSLNSTMITRTGMNKWSSIQFILISYDQAFNCRWSCKVWMVLFEHQRLILRVSINSVVYQWPCVLDRTLRFIYQVNVSGLSLQQEACNILYKANWIEREFALCRETEFSVSKFWKCTDLEISSRSSKLV